ncbi:hypothetical protein KSS87_001305 [Heliosperma pusillum]|nr:hypothetical protein KSS87_001305 [Heliosperma pusillum]
MNPQKRKCSLEHYAGRDRLSEMPDEVIVHILSYMTTVDAVKTMLIRSFGNLWTLVPTLKLDVEEFLNKMDPDHKWGSYDVGPFCIFVRNVLRLHKRPVIDKFDLCLGFDYEDGRMEAGDDITMWFKFALDKRAKEIVFCDVSYEFTKSSDFPNFTSQSLVTLELSNCTIYPQLQVNLGSLKKLILCQTKMTEETFRQFICGCPSLQELRIEDPYEIRNLSFSAPNILKLSLYLMDAEFDNDPWSFDFPNLKSLDLATNRIPNVIDVSSVRDFHLKDCSHHMDRDELRMFKIFLKKFRGTEVFRLSVVASEFGLFLYDVNVSISAIPTSSWSFASFTNKMEACSFGIAGVLSKLPLGQYWLCDAETEDYHPSWQLRKALQIYASSSGIFAQKRNCLGEIGICSEQASINNKGEAGEAGFCNACVELAEVFTKSQGTLSLSVKGFLFRVVTVTEICDDVKWGGYRLPLTN